MCLYDSLLKSQIANNLLTIKGVMQIKLNAKHTIDVIDDLIKQNLIKKVNDFNDYLKYY